MVGDAVAVTGVMVWVVDIDVVSGVVASVVVVVESGVFVLFVVVAASIDSSNNMKVVDSGLLVFPYTIARISQESARAPSA